MFLVSSCSCLFPIHWSQELSRMKKNEDVDGAAPTGDAPTTFDWTILLFIKVRFILEVLQ